jgi:hypothetical protein
MTKILWNIWVGGVNGNEIDYSHMEGLLHNYRISASEVVTIMRYISETSWRVCGIDWRMK